MCKQVLHRDARSQWPEGRYKPTSTDRGKGEETAVHLHSGYHVAETRPHMEAARKRALEKPDPKAPGHSVYPECPEQANRRSEPVPAGPGKGRRLVHGDDFRPGVQTLRSHMVGCSVL